MKFKVISILKFNSVSASRGKIRRMWLPGVHHVLHQKKWIHRANANPSYWISYWIERNEYGRSVPYRVRKNFGIFASIDGSYQSSGMFEKEFCWSIF